MCMLRIKGKFFNIISINVHLLNKQKLEEDKDPKYEQLQQAYHQFGSYEIKI